MNRLLTTLAFVVLSTLSAYAQMQQHFTGDVVPTGYCSQTRYTNLVTGLTYKCDEPTHTWQPNGATFNMGTGGIGDMLKANNLSDVLSASTARTNLGLGTLATQNGTVTDFALTDLSNVSGTVSVSNFPATQPVSMATNAPDVTDRSARLLGHVTVDSAPSTPITNANLDVALSTRTKPSDQQHAIIDSSALPSGASTSAKQDSQTTLLGGGLPLALISGRLDVNVGNALTVTANQGGAWTDRVVGSTGGAFDAANNAAAPANLISTGHETATQGTTQPTAATAGNVRRPVQSTDGAQYVRIGGAVTWSCGLDAIGATLTQCQGAPAAGLKLYVTDIVAQSTTTTGGQFGLRFGTGTNCATGVGNLFPSATATARYSSPANTVAPTFIHFIVPLSVTAANAICVLGVATNTTTITINGYTAP